MGPGLIVVALAAAGATGAAPAATHPHSLVLEVVFPEDVGRESVRAEIERLLGWDLESHRCFATVGSRVPDSPGETDLLFRVSVVDFEETTDWDVSLSQRERPRGPVEDAHRQVTVRMRVDLAYELFTIADRLLVRSKEVSLRQSYRPQFEEDPRIEARNLLVEEAIRSARMWVCKGSARGLSKEIARSRSRARAD